MEQSELSNDTSEKVRSDDLITKKTFTGPLPQILLDNNPLSIVSKEKRLGVVIDDKISWNKHVTKIIKNFSVKIKKLYQMKFLLKVSQNTITNKVSCQVLCMLSTFGKIAPTVTWRTA